MATHPLRTQAERPHEITITVYGTPAPQGSKRHVGGGRLIDDNAATLRTWREDVKFAALRAMEVTPGWDGDHYPIVVGHFAFTMPRPASHYRQGKETSHLLRSAAPKSLHGTKPDLDKLLRSTWDALQAAGVYLNDSRVAQMWATKAYPSEAGQPPGTLDRPGARIHLTGMAS